MVLQPIHPEDPHFYINQTSGSFLQTSFWAQFKAQQGWIPLFFNCQTEDTKGNSIDFFLSVLLKKISFFGFLCYVPDGPSIFSLPSINKENLLINLSKALKKHVPKSTFCIRYDPPFSKEKDSLTLDDSVLLNFTRPVLHTKKLIKATNDIQPPDTVILDLSKSQEILLSEMKPKWRYNCKLGLKKGLKIISYEGEEAKTTGIDIFYDLYKETAKRDKIAIHSKSYYQNLFLVNDKNIKVKIFVAYHEQEPLAAIITIYKGLDAVYVYGASSNNKRNLMPSYSLQWNALCDAQESGCLWYDFYGIPPTNKPNHPMYGLYRFKTGFGGSLIHKVGSWDYPVNKVAYYTFYVAEILRSFWFKKLIKLSKKISLKTS